MIRGRKRSQLPLFALSLLLCCASRYLVPPTGAFVLPSSTTSFQRTCTILHERRRKKEYTLKELIEKQTKNTAYSSHDGGRKKKYKRTRKRVDKPKQRYMYASQRKAALDHDGVSSSRSVVDEFDPVLQARQMGLMHPSAQHTDVVISDETPVINGQIRVDDGKSSDSMAYVVYKPAGWSILGSTSKQKAKRKVESVVDASLDTTTADDGNVHVKNDRRMKRVTLKDQDGSTDILEYNEDDILALLTPEERAEYEQDVMDDADAPALSTTTTASTQPDDLGVKQVVKIKEDDGSVDVLEYDESDILAVMTPDEIAEFQANGGFQKDDDGKDTGDSTATAAVVRKKVQARSSDREKKASFASPTRPSLVAWLKELKAEQGTPIRGGKNWKAVTGATNVNDSGLVVLCPKDKTDNLFVEYAKYVAVIGTGKYLAKPSKQDNNSVPKEQIKMDIVSKLRKGRNDDTVLTVGVTVLEQPSTCSSIVQPCQSQFVDGVRGDPAANPLDRRASRRLILCSEISVSSLVHDDTAQVETKDLPDDIAILAERRNKHEYVKGSFLGRSALRENPLTTAYREINGAADGFQGWTVDRYDKWLFVQHDDKNYKGPLPSIHDGNTVGVYYLAANPNRSAMGSGSNVRPRLLEGQPAPDIIPILENGVTYYASLDKDLSTGIFLDQRPQRAWLIRNCDENTRVLNCFAHCGAFSVAAASAGASTVSLDLNKKWLDRIEPQLLANNIEFDDKHDCIYGDCFDWLARLAKRGEKYDIVILDPPSSSVGKTKKRWSVKNDMASLVELAAPLVKTGGLLWTTTNSASIHPIKFARMCHKGLEKAGLTSAKLERVAPMPVDFPSIGPQPVKNLVWRI